MHGVGQSLTARVRIGRAGNARRREAMSCPERAAIGPNAFREATRPTVGAAATKSRCKKVSGAASSASAGVSRPLKASSISVAKGPSGANPGVMIKASGRRPRGNARARAAPRSVSATIVQPALSSMPSSAASGCVTMVASATMSATTRSTSAASVFTMARPRSLVSRRCAAGPTRTKADNIRPHSICASRKPCLLIVRIRNMRATRRIRLGKRITRSA